jgi:AraC family transcriptional regulator, transcriptional activator FtrA
MLKTVCVLLMDNFAPFEFGVVCEVFGVDRTGDGVPAFDFRVCGERPGEPLRATDIGAKLIPERGLDALLDADLVAIPAIRIREQYPSAILRAVWEAHERGATLLSVCSGAFVLGAAGLLDGRHCTTHWRHADELAERFPEAKVDPNVLFVDEGDIITSAGTASGIDACLHLVRREFGSGPATAIARRMVVPPQRDGGQRQYIATPIPEHTADSLQPLLAWMLETLDADHSVASLAEHASVSERTFARRFVAETGTTPHRWLSTQRVQHARTLLEQTDLSVEQIASACGFATAPLLRHHFRQLVGVTPADYRRAFSQIGEGPAMRTGAPTP